MPSWNHFNVNKAPIVSTVIIYWSSIRQFHNLQAAAAKDDDDDVDLFGEETEEEKKAAEERAAAVKASAKKKECKWLLFSICAEHLYLKRSVSSYNF